MRQVKFYATPGMRPVAIVKQVECDICMALHCPVPGMWPPVCPTCERDGLLTDVDHRAYLMPINGGFTLRRWLAFCG